MIAAVKVEINPDVLPGEGQIWLIEVDSNYSLDNVQRCLVDSNREIFGQYARVAGEVGRVKSVKKLLAWADRKGRNRYGLPPLTGWCGPVRLERKVGTE